MCNDGAGDHTKGDRRFRHSRESSCRAPWGRWGSILLLVCLALASPRAWGQGAPLGQREIPKLAMVSVIDSSLERPSDDYVPAWYSMFTNIPRNWLRFVRTTITGEQLPAMVGMTVLTAGLVLTDDDTWRMSHRWYQGSASVRDMSDFFVYLGDGRPQFGLAAGFAAYGFVARDRRSLRTASQTVEAILSCGIVVQVLKHMTGRESPYVSTRPGGRWDLLPNQIEYHKHVPHFDAYPSGHIATALATVTVVTENYSECWWMRPLGYSVVALLGVSMANSGIHWYSDYPLGLGLGYCFGMLAAHPEEMGGIEAERTRGSTNVAVAPTLTAAGAGFAVTISF